MKSVRFDRLLASTALGLVLVLSSHPGMAQQADQQKIDAAVPVPDTTLPPAPTAKDIAPAPADATPAPQQDAATPAAAPAKSDTAATAPANADTPKADTNKADTATSEPAKADPAKPDAAQNAAAPAAEPPQAAPVENAATPAAEPAKPAPVTVAAVPDSAVADKLRELITGKQFERMVGRKAERSGIEHFYSAHNYAPIWVANGAATARATSATSYLGKADDVGLDPTDYPTPVFKADMSADALAEAELKLTASALAFAREAQIGRIHFSRVSADIAFNLVAPEPAEVLAKLSGSDDAGKVLDAYNPPQPEFKALRAKLAELRKNGGAVDKPADDKPNLVRVPEGKLLRPGMKDARVIALRQRLDVAGDKQNPLFDEAVSDAVKTFQTANDLNVDGNVGNVTVRALNGEKREARHAIDPIDTIIVNMERWRWLPRDLGNPHVVVNVPDYSLTLWNNDKVYWHSKIVAGKPGHATPLMSAEMKFITVNPTWNVPPSIIEKEYLPALQQDPDALDRIGLKMRQDPDGTVHVYQPPGARNALGRIRFNFPNKFLVYQHDTPDKYLFAKDKRAYSHGCMRVQNPFTYAEKLLSLTQPSEHYTEARIESMLGDNEININFPKPIWVHLTYQTAFVDENGKLQLRDDVYGHDAHMLAILKGSERKVADIAIERPPNTSSKPVRMPVGMYGGDRGNAAGYSNSPNFFDWLFNSPRAQQQQQRQYFGPPRGPNGRYSER
ncbi:MAG TPA: L,D-transpeptidase family protein [Pseudolabrys sp.]|nr:L,D-transpeptidase family protein [Pseudolabrys sp.]